MNLFNRCGWDEWVSVDICRLRLLSCSGCEKSALKARDELVQAGLVAYRRGKKGCPNKYKMISFSVKFTEKTTEKMTEKTTEYPTTINKLKQKHKHITHLSNSLLTEKESRDEQKEKNLQKDEADNFELPKNANGIAAPKSKKVTAQKHKYGEYENVLLTDEELEKLKDEFKVDYQERIERLSEYIASTGKVYKSHLATIRMWARKEKPQVIQPSEQRDLSANEEVTWADFPNASEADKAYMTPQKYKERVDSLRNITRDRTGGVF